MEQPPRSGGVRCHIVWIGPALPYYARLAVESALVAMPDAEVHVHSLGAAPAGEHADALTGWPRVRFHRVEPADLFETCPGGAGPYVELLSRLSTVGTTALSNLVRLAVLRRHGGVYLDADVIVVRGLHDPDRHGAYVGREHVWAANRARLEGRLGVAGAFAAAPWAATWLARRADARWLGGRARLAERIADRATRLQVNNAVIGSPRAAPFLDAALTRALQVDPARRLALGPSLLDDVATAHPRLVRVVPPSRFFPVPPGQSFRVFEDVRLTLPVDTQVVHYVASNHRRLLAGIGPGDPRFTSGRALFWRLGGEVQRAVAAGAAGGELGEPARVDPRRAG